MTYIAKVNHFKRPICSAVNCLRGTIIAPSDSSARRLYEVIDI